MIYQDLKNYTAYRFECALRSSAILGFIGLPTLGYHLETAFREGMYNEAAALLYVFYLLILSLKLWARSRFILFPILVALVFTSWETSFSWANLSRFFTYNILPWPMREQGFYTGTMGVVFSFSDVMSWLWQVFTDQAMPGIRQTFFLTQTALVLTALFSLATFAPASRIFYGPGVTRTAHVILLVLRTTPEYILAYIGLQLLGPSMLPAIAALSLHNGTILAYPGYFMTI